MMFRPKLWLQLLTGALILSVFGHDMTVQGAPQNGSTIQLPLVANRFDLLGSARRINAPYFTTADILGQKFSEMGIFWYGQVTPAENYTDIRVAYNDTELDVYAAVFDRRAWFDTTPSAADLTQWDSVSVYLDLAGITGAAPALSTYRLDAQLGDNTGQPLVPGSKAAYRGNGTTWVTAAVPFTATAAWQGEHINDDTDDRGWVVSFRIPFASLGVTRPTANAANAWGLAVATHDRDDAAGTPIPDTFWPETANFNIPWTWGQLRWGLPLYAAPAAANPQTTVLRQGLNGITVQDADLGGAVTNQCPGDAAFIWNQWGNTNYGAATGLNIQNQDNIADWPCFAKSYLAFPLTSIPAGQVIISATLTLHQTGGSGTASNNSPPYDEYIQVLTVNENWAENSVTWNNAPLAFENFGGLWVTTVVGCGTLALTWPCVPRTWDVSAAVAQAYARGTPARLVLYSASTGISTGKYFLSSQAFMQGTWAPEVFVGRPTLTIRWGTP